mmetsp:Transcript_9894/g.45062  ORF Transcript_9894/g.45062 Transcript_9894/m.45062 type:complete len:324 (-) Transcript_9894:13293-14264(-)
MRVPISLGGVLPVERVDAPPRLFSRRLQRRDSLGHRPLQRGGVLRVTQGDEQLGELADRLERGGSPDGSSDRAARQVRREVALLRRATRAQTGSSLFTPPLLPGRLATALGGRNPRSRVRRRRLRPRRPVGVRAHAGHAGRETRSLGRGVVVVAAAERAAAPRLRARVDRATHRLPAMPKIPEPREVLVQAGGKLRGLGEDALRSLRGGGRDDGLDEVGAVVKVRYPRRLAPLPGAGEGPHGPVHVPEVLRRDDRRRGRVGQLQTLAELLRDRGALVPGQAQSSGESQRGAPRDSLPVLVQRGPRLADGQKSHRRVLVPSLAR